MKGDTPEITIRLCGRNNAALNGCITVLQDEQKGLERLHSGFASCTKGHEVTSFAWKFCTRNNRALNVCMAVLHREQ